MGETCDVWIWVRQVTRMAVKILVDGRVFQILDRLKDEAEADVERHVRAEASAEVREDRNEVRAQHHSHPVREEWDTCATEELASWRRVPTEITNIEHRPEIQSRAWELRQEHVHHVGYVHKSPIIQE